MPDISALQKARSQYQPKLPAILQGDLKKIGIQTGSRTTSVADQEAIHSRFPQTYGQPELSFGEGGKPLSAEPLKVGFVLSGGQAPGGHNVVWGLLDGLKRLNPASQLIGYLGGPSGILKNQTHDITPGFMESYRNTGGFDMIGSGRTKLETAEDFETCRKVLQAAGVQVLVVVGGDDSNTNAAVLAEYFASQKAGIRVLGVPKTIDGDLKNEKIETSFGFDTATKTYAELVGNVARDAMSARKYWHFIRLMGRAASHIALEVGLKTRPNVCLISEEVAAAKQTLEGIANEIADVVARRAELGRNFGIVLVPEGLVEFVPEMKGLITELNDLLAAAEKEFAGLAPDALSQKMSGRLSPGAGKTFTSLPAAFRQQLLAERDPHGNVQVSRIETEKLLMESVAAILETRKAAGTYKGKFSSLSHFFGYEGRAAQPSNFDADYCYSLGFNAACLAASGATGYLSSVSGLVRSAAQWQAGGVPITMMMNMERRHGGDKPVIQKALVNLQGKPLAALKAGRPAWSQEDSYFFPGPIQYWGPTEVADCISETLRLEQAK
jgi:pyrophosphate--fructose-6-phosphate 1-phosphotransferase